MHTRYLTLLLILTAVLCTAVTAFTVLVDPLDIYRVVVREGFNLSKTEYQKYARLAKPVQIEFHQPERLAFGSSRVDLAMPMEYGKAAKQFPNGFNAGLNSANLQSILEVLQHASITGEVKDVLIGVDFYMFNSLNQMAYTYPEALASLNPNPWQRRFKQVSTTVFSPGMLEASLATVRHQDGPPKRKPSGQAFMAPEIEKARDDGYENQFRRYEDGLVRHVWTACRDNRFAYQFAGNPDSLAIFRDILRLAKTEGFRLTLFIAPVHARMLEVLDASGLWHDYEQWKRDMVTMIEAEQNPSITLWDFSGYHEYAAEPLPADPAGTMRWYIDSSHYTEALAERMLDVMYDGATGFGVPLDSHMINDHLNGLRSARDLYRASHAEQFRGLQERAQRLLAEKARNGKHCPESVPSDL
ncbi:MAG: hypothetical protein EP312_02085 [Gammaproteobacteria bacterium]|nr:MAG: hypothetical protein EP312_02085 [Gammaproteobacteria bacterium]